MFKFVIHKISEYNSSIINTNKISKCKCKRNMYRNSDEKKNRLFD